MLILTRKISQSLVIDDDIYCTILGVSGNHVRLGFNAPKSKPIHREEIHQLIQQKRHNEFSQETFKFENEEPKSIGFACHTSLEHAEQIH